MIALVTFDFWQTLFADTAESAAAAHALRLAGVGKVLARAGHPYDAAAMDTADARALAALQSIWQEHRDVTHHQQVRIFLEAIDPALPTTLAPVDREAVASAYAAPVLTYTPVLAPGAVDAIRELGARGLQLGVISNTGRTPGAMLHRLLARLGLADGTHVLSFSDEGGARKPAPEIFERTLARAGCRPAEAVHVGDDPAADVAGARAVGMGAVHYVPDDRPAAAGASGVLRHFADLPALLTRLA